MEAVHYKVAYSYDPLNRLTRASYRKDDNETTVVYECDERDNLIYLGADGTHFPSHQDASVQETPQVTEVEKEPGTQLPAWYMSRAGQVFGPYTLEQLNAFVGEGRLNDDDLVWHDSLSQWTEFSQIPK